MHSTYPLRISIQRLLRFRQGAQNLLTCMCSLPKATTGSMTKDLLKISTQIMPYTMRLQTGTSPSQVTKLPSNLQLFGSSVATSDNKILSKTNRDNIHNVISQQKLPLVPLLCLYPGKLYTHPCTLTINNFSNNSTVVAISTKIRMLVTRSQTTSVAITICMKSDRRDQKGFCLLKIT